MEIFEMAKWVKKEFPQEGPGVLKGFAVSFPINRIQYSGLPFLTHGQMGAQRVTKSIFAFL